MKEFSYSPRKLSEPSALSRIGLYSTKYSLFTGSETSSFYSEPVTLRNVSTPLLLDPFFILFFVSVLLGRLV